MNLFSRMLVAVAGAGMIAGCNDKESVEQVVVPPSSVGPQITVTPVSVTLFPGDTFRLRVLYSGDVRWSTSRPDLSDVDSLTGLVRAKATGKMTVVARVVADTAWRGAAAVEIVPRP
jgi:hypothetical protein